MRLLMLNNEYPPLGGGTATVNQEILSRLAAVPGLEIDLVTSSPDTRRHEERIWERVRIIRVPVRIRNLHHASNRELVRYARKALPVAIALHREQAYDLCFAWSAVPAGGVALALRRLAGLPYLVRVCGPDIPGFERRYRALYPLITPLIRMIWRGASVVVAKCEGEADMIRVVDARVGIELVPNGVDIDRFRAGEPIPDDGALRMLCVGRLIERKGQRHLIRAVKRLLDDGVEVTLELVGTGDAQPAYEALVRELGLKNDVRFSGYVPREDMAKTYARAHVFVLPSYNEGMSVATLEAIAAGLPVIVSRTGGAEELVAEGENGFAFGWGDVDALAAHLRRMALDRPLARKMGAASRVRAERFSWDAAVNRYVTLFSDISSTSHACSQGGVDEPCAASVA
jgi:glycosyltransferase involved in cell wall biosynthesis